NDDRCCCAGSFGSSPTIEYRERMSAWKGMQAMRKIVAGLFMSIDGVVERPDQWTGPHFNEEIGQLVGSLIAGGDTLLLGRQTYQEFAEAFGKGTGGDPMEAV